MPCNTCTNPDRCDRAGLCQDFGFAPATQQVITTMEDIHGAVCGGAVSARAVDPRFAAAHYQDGRDLKPPQGGCAEHPGYDGQHCPRCAPVAAAPIDMVLHCPKCHMQHIDQPEQPTRLHADRGCGSCGGTGQTCDYPTCLKLWTNPPHRSHLCRKDEGGCGTVWRPADVPTNGVAAVKTRGKVDTWPNLNPVCGNCDTPVPPGCDGIFTNDGEHCALSRGGAGPCKLEGGA